MKAIPAIFSNRPTKPGVYFLDNQFEFTNRIKDRKSIGKSRFAVPVQKSPETLHYLNPQVNALLGFIIIFRDRKQIPYYKS